MKLYELFQVSGYTDIPEHFKVELLKPGYQGEEEFHSIDLNFNTLVQYCNYKVDCISVLRENVIEVIIKE